MSENSILSEVNSPIVQTSEQNQTLPLSYVLWLTMRSRFIDELGKKDPDILELWQQYEDQQMEIVTKEMEVK